MLQNLEELLFVAWISVARLHVEPVPHRFDGVQVRRSRRPLHIDDPSLIFQSLDVSSAGERPVGSAVVVQERELLVVEQLLRFRNNELLEDFLAHLGVHASLDAVQRDGSFRTESTQQVDLRRKRCRSTHAFVIETLALLPPDMLLPGAVVSASPGLVGEKNLVPFARAPEDVLFSPGYTLPTVLGSEKGLTSFDIALDAVLQETALHRVAADRCPGSTDLQGNIQRSSSSSISSLPRRQPLYLAIDEVRRNSWASGFSLARNTSSMVLQKAADGRSRAFRLKLICQRLRNSCVAECCCSIFPALIEYRDGGSLRHRKVSIALFAHDVASASSL